MTAADGVERCNMVTTLKCTAHHRTSCAAPEHDNVTIQRRVLHELNEKRTGAIRTFMFAAKDGSTCSLTGGGPEIGDAEEDDGVANCIEECQTSARKKKHASTPLMLKQPQNRLKLNERQ